MTAGWREWLRLGSAGLGAVLSSLACIVFGLGYGNLQASCWAAVSSLAAAVLLALHLQARAGRLQRWLPRLTALRNVSLAGLSLATAAVVYYAYWAAALHQPVYPIRFVPCLLLTPVMLSRESLTIRTVWAFMAAKWFAGLAYYSHRHQARLASDPGHYNQF